MSREIVWTADRLARARALLAEGLTERQVAERFGVSRTAVRIAMSRAAGRKARESKPIAEARANARPRPCLRCGTPMRSTGAHHRMCDPCRAGNGLPHDWQGAGV